VRRLKTHAKVFLYAVLFGMIAYFVVHIMMRIHEMLIG